MRLRAARESMTGHFEQACDLADSAYQLAVRVGDISMVGMYHAFLIQLALVRGDPAHVPPDAMRLLRQAPAIPLVKVAVPMMLALRGDLDAARAEFAPLRSLPALMPLGPRWAGTIGQIAHVAILLGDAEVARECYRLLLPTAPWCAGDGGGSPFSAASNARVISAASNELLLGWLAQALSDWDTAAGHFERAAKVDDRLGARPYAALARLHLAECLAAVADRAALAEGAPDTARSQQLAGMAAAEFERLDMPGPLSRAQPLLTALSATGSRLGLGRGTNGRAAGAGLTTREAEVAELVGKAMTNQQIADRLFLSVRTVESHVRSILAKLHLATRTEIAVWLREP